MKKTIQKIYFFLGFLVLFTGCKKDDHNHNDHDVINKLSLELTAGSEIITLSFDDPDGDGGMAPTILGGILKSNTIYNGTIRIYTKHDSHYDELTSEIVNEADVHQFFFSSTVSGIVVNYTDKDGSNNPIGLSHTIRTGASGTGSLRVVLRHEPDKNASGVSSGDITNAGGETDIDISFPITIN